MTAAQMEGSLGQIRAAWHILAQGAPAAAETLVELSGGARSEFVRAQASMAVLDRVGLGTVEAVVVENHLDGGDGGQADLQRSTARAVLAARMAALGAPTGALEAAPDPEIGPGGAGAGHSGVLEGDLVHEDPRQDDGV